MKCISTQQANEFLNSIGMTIGDWSQIADLQETNLNKSSWINCPAPKTDLLNFSHHVAGWLPKGSWKIFQIDNSSGWMDPVQLSLFAGLLFGADKISEYNQTQNRTFLFEFGKNKDSDSNDELLLANLIYIFLLFESHGYIVSSNSYSGQSLGIQDGYVYFSSREQKDISNAETLLGSFARNPKTRPQWVIEVYVDRQQQFLEGKIP